MADKVTRPDHYRAGRKYEPKDVIRDWDLNFNLGNVVKYISRCGRKEGNSVLQELEKARTYLDFEIQALVEDNLIKLESESPKDGLAETEDVLYKAAKEYGVGNYA